MDYPRKSFFDIRRPVSTNMSTYPHHSDYSRVKWVTFRVLTVAFSKGRNRVAHHRNLPARARKSVTPDSYRVRPALFLMLIQLYLKGATAHFDRNFDSHHVLTLMFASRSATLQINGQGHLQINLRVRSGVFSPSFFPLRRLVQHDKRRMLRSRCE